MHTDLTLVGLPNAVGFAHQFTRTTLRHFPVREVVDNAELIVSELPTNAVETTGLAMSAPISAISPRHLVNLTLSITGDLLHIEIWDGQGGQPFRRGATSQVENEGCRSLLLVEALSRQWGTAPSPYGGKIVWCTLALEARTVNGSPKTEAPQPGRLPRRPPGRTLEGHHSPTGRIRGGSTT
ncbi:ATP-binding protein [Allosalinactinospora lopnorensis]|uniref:ATP-binding protein n=1 Tax=Allosalinactinospora lopnorensis TaxID=1352348 RepID=UPI000623C455|nr:ATP-binding protein [Allosalinactinospora lopnorensis]